MNRVALDLGFFQIYWYSIFILLGIVFGMLVIYKEMKKQCVGVNNFTDLVFNTIIIGIIGARLYYVLFNYSYYLSNPIEIFEIWNGGLAIHGGILFGVIYITYFCHKRKLNNLKVLDMIVVGLILGQAIGRWGNFFNQEAYGSVTTYKILKAQNIPEFIINGMNIGGIYYTPTFLYESLWDIIGFLLLLVMRLYPKIRVGQLTGIYLVWYSFGRFVIEGLRTDSLMLGSIKMAQLVSIFLLFLGVYIITKAYLKDKNINKNLYHADNANIKEEVKEAIIYEV